MKPDAGVASDASSPVAAVLKPEYTAALDRHNTYRQKHQVCGWVVGECIDEECHTSCNEVLWLTPWAASDKRTSAAAASAAAVL